MVVIVRDRVKALIDAGATLQQVKAARVTADYETRFGANTGNWTTDMFVEGVYTSLKAKRSRTNACGGSAPSRSRSGPCLRLWTTDRNRRVVRQVADGFLE
jgi:hypothetical protein